ncbi:hypothetical protein BJY01DRAFT_249337 [Aspergillus pseudoustus]|uniref:Uncharacterized protein n=1 Tax=Aspergillus pseudoustus TaxID=1810923 RepID=A0ABR4JPT9_9EURO
MSSPGETGKLNLCGSWQLDKARSTNLDPVLQLQGIGWVTRKAISVSTVTLKITQGSDDADTDADGWITLEQVLTGGIRGAPEKRQLDWTVSEHNDTIFGRVLVQSRHIPGATDSDGRLRPVLEVQTQVDRVNVEAFLNESVLPDQTIGQNKEKAFMHDYIRSPNGGWTAEQVSIN